MRKTRSVYYLLIRLFLKTVFSAAKLLLFCCIFNFNVAYFHLNLYFI